MGTKAAAIIGVVASLVSGVAIFIADGLQLLDGVSDEWRWAALIVCGVIFIVCILLLVWLIRNEGGVQPMLEQSTSGPSSPNAGTTGDNSPATAISATGDHAQAAGRDIHNTTNLLRDAEKPKPSNWMVRSGAPQLTVSREILNGRFIGSFEVFDSTPPPADFQAHPEGAGADTEPLTLMRENPRPGVQQRFQWKVKDVHPTHSDKLLTLHVQFTWDNELHGGSWTWPLAQRSSNPEVWWIDNGIPQPRFENPWSQPLS
ncbi:MAG: hypothetical protein HW403_1431 [Dehalococcoidia bacterium]|nr:hypothetical protein [Dehalococcoidia bacterium]